MHDGALEGDPLTLGPAAVNNAHPWLAVPLFLCCNEDTAQLVHEFSTVVEDSHAKTLASDRELREPAAVELPTAREDLGHDDPYADRDR
ncbi:hypothetical protein GCM10022403_035040 [Streptomyces coacervatus]|uniref:Uncharacterized protein n=1 Tax=Streptomyces coacervatus TaxID=647381 RepID=A0ABP7HRP0_9ACTN